jgi:hypothetical protein
VAVVAEPESLHQQSSLFEVMLWKWQKARMSCRTCYSAVECGQVVADKWHTTCSKVERLLSDHESTCRPCFARVKTVMRLKFTDEYVCTDVCQV